MATRGDDSGRKRRPHNELKYAMRDYIAACPNGQASIAEIKAGTVGITGEAPASSYRSGLQDTSMFERVSRGVFKLAHN